VSRHRKNPWFSPPAIQYVARFANPYRQNPRKRHQDREREHDRFTFLAQQGQHHQVEEVLHSLGLTYCTEPFSPLGRAGTWGRAGFLVKAEVPEGMSKRSINRALYEAGVPGAKRAGVKKRPDMNPHYRSNPWFSPPAIQYVARFANPPGQGYPYAEHDEESEYGHHCPEDPHVGCGICGGPPVCDCPPGMCPRENPGYGMSMLEDMGSDYQGPPGFSQDVYHNPGYGMSMLEDMGSDYQAPPRFGRGAFHNPAYKVRHHTEEFQCPACGDPVYVGDYAYEDPGTGEVYCCSRCARKVRENPTHYPSPLAERVARRISRGSGTKSGIWDDVDAVLRHGQSNPAGYPRRTGPVTQFGMAAAWGGDRSDEVDDEIVIRGREVPVNYSKGGKYHHVRVGDPDQYTAIKTKTLSDTKGIKARVGRFLGRGPRGGKTEIQSYLFDATMYTPQDVARWIEGHRTPRPLLMDIAPTGATKRRMKVYGEASEAPTKIRKKSKRKVAKRKKREAAVKAGKKKPARRTPPEKDRCKAKLKAGGRCKGWKQKGKQKCSLHVAGVAGKRQPKKKAKAKKRKRKAG
jgi:hypothetical protein